VRACVWSTSWTWAYRPSVSVGVEWRANSWATFTFTPLRTSRLMYVCLRAWKSATRPARSRYLRKDAFSRSLRTFSDGASSSHASRAAIRSALMTFTGLSGILKTGLPHCLPSSQGRSRSARSRRMGWMSFRRCFE